MSTLSRTLISIALALPAFVHAADNSSNGKPMLSREEVEQCVADRNEVVARNQALSAQKVQIDARGDALIQNESRMKDAQNSLKPDLAQLQEHQDELKRRTGDINAYIPQAMVVKKLNADYKDRVDRYNADVRAHQVLLDQYNIDADALNKQLDALDAKARSVDKRCVNKPAKRADIDAVKSANEEKPRTTVLTPETRVLP